MPFCKQLAVVRVELAKETEVRVAEDERVRQLLETKRRLIQRANTLPPHEYPPESSRHKPQTGRNNDLGTAETKRPSRDRDQTREQQPKQSSTQANQPENNDRIINCERKTMTQTNQTMTLVRKRATMTAPRQVGRSPLLHFRDPSI